MTLPAPIATSLNLYAGLLESTAGVLRAIAGTAPRPEAADPSASVPAEPSAAAAKPPAGHGTKPAAGTRAQISSPKAARKARRRGAVG